MKKKSKKQLQVGENFKRFISKLFQEEDSLNFSQCHITVVEVDVSPDLKNIKIFINIFGNDDLNDQIIKYLNKQTAFFNRKIAQELLFRSIPNLVFINDDTTKKSARIYSLIDMENNKK